MSNAKHETIADIVDEINREFEKLRAENARLRAALKPVLDIVIDRYTSDLSMAMAIRESKRIYNDGGESEAKEAVS